MKSSAEPDRGSAHVVVGASSGVGAAVVEALAARGSRVYAVSRRGTTTADAPTVTPLPCDIRSFEEVGRLLHGIPEPVRHVVNCAGVGFYAPMEGDDCSTAWNEMAQTNLVGLANLLSAAHGLPEPPTDFLLVNTLAAYRPSKVAGNAFYSATKTAARLLMEDYRRTLRASGRRTRVLSVSPGFVTGTDFGRNFYRDRPELDTDLYGEFRALSPREVAEQILFVLDAPEHIELTDVIMRPQGQRD